MIWLLYGMQDWTKEELFSNNPTQIEFILL